MHAGAGCLMTVLVGGGREINRGSVGRKGSRLIGYSFEPIHDSFMIHPYRSPSVSILRRCCVVCCDVRRSLKYEHQCVMRRGVNHLHYLEKVTRRSQKVIVVKKSEEKGNKSVKS